MSPANSTSSYSPSSEVLSICRSLGDLNNPSKATSTSITTSLSAIITTALTFPLAAFLNALILVAFYKNSTLRKRANVFLMALALTDLIRAVLAYPFFLVKETLYQKKHEPSCFVMLFLFNTNLFVSSDLLLTALNVERFIGLRYAIWHRVHVTKSFLVKVAVVCGVLGGCVSLARTFTEKALIPIVLLFLCTSIATCLFAVLIWRDIKKRNEPQVCPQPGQVDQSVAKARNSPQVQRQPAVQDFQNEQARRLNVPQEVTVSRYNSILKRGKSRKDQEQGHLQREYEESVESQDRSNPDDRKGNSYLIPLSKIHSAVEIQKQVKSRSRSEGNNQQQATSQPNSQPVLPVTSTHRSAILTKPERKAAKVATYLVLGLLFTRIIPIMLLYAVIKEFELKYVIPPLMQALALMVSVVNPVIFIATNLEIRRACLKLLKCWDA